MTADRFFVNLLAPLAEDAAADAAGRALAAVLADPAAPAATKRHAAYYMAQVHEFCGAWDEMAAMLEYSGVAPGRDADDYDILAHAGWAHVFRHGQEQAVARGIPAIHINALPQSGSSFVTAFVTTALGIERCRTSKGPYMTARVVPAWMAAFARGGATTHEHFAATPENIRALEASGIAATLVHVRHPVAALLSAYRLFEKSADREVAFSLRQLKAAAAASELRDPKRGFARFAQLFLGYILQFMRSWMDYSRRPEAAVRVHFSRYEDAFGDPPAFAARLLSLFLGRAHGIDGAAIVARMQADAEAGGAYNYQRGRSNLALDRLDPAARAAIDPLLPPDLMAFYGYAASEPSGSGRVPGTPQR